MNQDISKGTIYLSVYINGHGNQGTLDPKNKVKLIEKYIEIQHEELLRQPFLCDGNLVLHSFWLPTIPL